jgi:transposase-like protein
VVFCHFIPNSPRAHRQQRRQFSPEFKADAVALVRSSGRPITAIARELGIGESTGQQHSFQMAAGLAPEADDAINRFAAWARPKLGIAEPAAE